MTRFSTRLVKALDRALRTELEQREDRGLCIGTVVLPRGEEIWCPEEATNGSWCDDHDPGEWSEDGETDPTDPYAVDSEFGNGMTRTEEFRDERYRYRGDRWSG